MQRDVDDRRSFGCDFVFLNISSKKTTTRFGKLGKLAPRYTFPLSFREGWCSCL